MAPTKERIMSANSFLDRVFAKLPALSPGGTDFASWTFDRRPTNEGVGVVSTPGLDVERMAARVMDVGHYVGNVDYVVECRVVADPAAVPPTAVRFYQRVKVPVLAEIQMELVLTDHGLRDGWRVLAWHQLDEPTDRLDPKRGARSEYNVGAWLLKNDRVAYALSSSPRKDDVGRLKFAALTTGADAGAPSLVRASVAGMVAWSKRSA
jgi:hypothetical protein